MPIVEIYLMSPTFFNDASSHALLKPRLADIQQDYEQNFAGMPEHHIHHLLTSCKAPPSFARTSANAAQKQIPNTQAQLEKCIHSNSATIPPKAP